jgi:hypothetical protein
MTLVPSRKLGKVGIEADSNRLKSNILNADTIAERLYLLAAPLTNTDFDGDSFSTVGASTAIKRTDWSSPLPASAKALIIEILCNDSGSGAAACSFSVGPSSTYYYMLTAHGAGTVNDATFSAQGIVRCEDNDADIYYRCTATGSTTLDVTLRVWGYWL